MGYRIDKTACSSDMKVNTYETGFTLNEFVIQLISWHVTVVMVDITMPVMTCYREVGERQKIQASFYATFSLKLFFSWNYLSSNPPNSHFSVPQNSFIFSSTRMCKKKICDSLFSLSKCIFLHLNILLGNSFFDFFYPIKIHGKANHLVIQNTSIRIRVPLSMWLMHNFVGNQSPLQLYCSLSWCVGMFEERY